MTITLDEVGRVAIPAEIREKQGLFPGAQIEITSDELGIRLIRAVPGPELVEEGGLRFSRPTVSLERLPSVDVGRLIDEERTRSPW